MTSQSGNATTLACEEGCGCKFPHAKAFVLSIDGVDHFFCCSDCADSYRRNFSTETSQVLHDHVVAGQTVADLGCGLGHYTAMLSGLVAPHGHVYATDVKVQRIRLLRDTLRRMGKESIVTAKVTPSARLPFIPNESLDFVLSNDVLCCLNSRSTAIREINRILKHNGLAYIRASRASPTGVSPIQEGEWSNLMSPFRRIRSGGDETIRWAFVSKR